MNRTLSQHTDHEVRNRHSCRSRKAGIVIDELGFVGAPCHAGTPGRSGFDLRPDSLHRDDHVTELKRNSDASLSKPSAMISGNRLI
ncbi:hypothetical protein [Burkholderia sp. BCC1972]|uniref:hypothetical protein n=1 Tax=Burkholderia sp. BCC1972 TaxID=2817438 RepID=UPI002ABE330E|nr:hypothetical protein [Burkholderia sp. BCC1972]